MRAPNGWQPMEPDPGTGAAAGPSNPGATRPTGDEAGRGPATGPAWQGKRFRVAERRLTLGRQYEVTDEGGRLVAYASQKWFRVKEAFSFHTDRSKSAIAFTAQATKVFDFRANIEVRDAQGNVLGTLRRKGWESIVADKWQVLGSDGALLGALEESTGRGLARRMLTRLIPYRAAIKAPDGTSIARVEGTFQVWGDTYDVHVDAPRVDARVLAGLVVIVDAMSAERGSLLDVTGLGS